ncbi:Calcineurin B-like protein 10 (SOS3-like calcium binding protein 8) (SCaBP8) [Durusdinium trenchii]|uniref:Calcineurin B-like protein 10 (SOS3-like calcium binding protein 8) (SCaBP8) n=1 Tax=Durusdinium trenchii TaxID=1381693 RepID=A0ABP0L7M5_9DINO
MAARTLRHFPGQFWVRPSAQPREQPRAQPEVAQDLELAITEGRGERTRAQANKGVRCRPPTRPVLSGSVDRGASPRTRQVAEGASSSTATPRELDDEAVRFEVAKSFTSKWCKDIAQRRKRVAKLRARRTVSKEGGEETVASSKCREGAKPVKPTKPASRRKPHPTSEVSNIHGFLLQQDIAELVKTTQYTRRELFVLFNRFKALSALSANPAGIDKEAFRKGVPLLSVEDDLFVDRVFTVLDEDGSGIIDWHEFIEAMSSLEKGSREKRTEFLFRVYDIDKDGGITRDELCQFFTSSLMVTVDANIKEVSDYFVEQVFSEVDLNGDGSMNVEEALQYIQRAQTMPSTF